MHRISIAEARMIIISPPHAAGVTYPAAAKQGNSSTDWFCYWSTLISAGLTLRVPSLTASSRAFCPVWATHSRIASFSPPAHSDSTWLAGADCWPQPQSRRKFAFVRHGDCECAATLLFKPRL